MENQKVRIKADSVAQAEEKARAIMPSGLSIREEKILCKENQKVLKRASAETEEEAFKKAMDHVDAGAEVIEKKVVIIPYDKTIISSAPDEKTAKESVAKQVDSTARLKTVKLEKPGKPVLGIWKRPNQYSVEVSQPVVVEVTYKSKAEIEVVFGGYKCAKCGRTWDQLENQFAEAKTRGMFVYGEGVPVLLYCENCKQSFCGSCQIDLGMDSGCPNCRNELHAWG